LLDLGLAAIHLFSALVAVLVGASLINQEVERRTILALLAKPVSPTEFVVGKHLGLAAVLTVLVTALGLVFLTVMMIQGVTVPLPSLLWAIGFTAVEAVVLAAIALFFGSFTSTILATLLSLATYLMGHLSANLVGLTTLSDNPGLTHLAQTLYLVLPDLERFNLRNQAVYGTALLPDLPTLVNHLLYGVVYIALLLGLASLAFSRRPR
jgi:ABC-type transport system involved in multi-copper enzyme maturation permease subunit